MASFRTCDLDLAARYKLLIGLIVPRPIASITSQRAFRSDGFIRPMRNRANSKYLSVFSSEKLDDFSDENTLGPNGKINFAPFSAFTFVSTEPPMVGISAGAHKDTPNNVIANGEFIVNIADTSLAEPLHLSSIEYPREVSKVEELGLALAPSSEISTPRLAVAPASMECKLHGVTEYGAMKVRFFVGAVVAFYIRDHLVLNGKVETCRLDPLARLAGPRYSGIGPEIAMNRLSAAS